MDDFWGAVAFLAAILFYFPAHFFFAWLGAYAGKSALKNFALILVLIIFSCLMIVPFWHSEDSRTDILSFDRPERALWAFATISSIIAGIWLGCLNKLEWLGKNLQKIRAAFFTLILIFAGALDYREIPHNLIPVLQTTLIYGMPLVFAVYFLENSKISREKLITPIISFLFFCLINIKPLLVEELSGSKYDYIPLFDETYLVSALTLIVSATIGLFLAKGARNNFTLPKICRETLFFCFFVLLSWRICFSWQVNDCYSPLYEMHMPIVVLATIYFFRFVASGPKADS